MLGYRLSADSMRKNSGQQRNEEVELEEKNGEREIMGVSDREEREDQ